MRKLKLYVHLSAMIHQSMTNIAETMSARLSRIGMFGKKLVVCFAVGINFLASAENGWTNIDGVQWFYKTENEEITLGGVYVSGAVYSNGTAIPTDTPGHLDIPVEIQGYPVRTIEQHAFFQCYKLTDVVIPEGVVNIGYGAFRNCSGLSMITIPSTMTNVSNDLFLNCGLKRIVIPQSMIDKTMCELGCNLVTNIQFSSAITNIGDYAFSKCTMLATIDIPYGAKGIGARAFEECSSLKSIAIPNSVEKIGNYAFIYCRSLTNVVVPQSVTNIALNAFWGCSGLVTAYIPLHLRGTFDEQTVFGDCSPSLRIVYYASEIMPDVRSYEGVYDGLGHGIDVRLSEELLSPSEIKFSLSEAGPYHDDPILFTNVTEEAENVWYTISAEGYATITNFATVKIMPRELLDEMVVIEEVDLVYDATPKEPMVFVQDGELSALSVQDYEVAYSNNVNGGFASIVVSGKRNYRGKVLKHFAIRLMVAFDANGGEGGVTNKQDYGSEIVAPKVARLGYVFDGWEPEVAGTVPVSNVTYIAQWRPNQYNVTFDANGGTGVMDEQLFVYDEEQALSPLLFTFADHRFVGWTRESEGEIVYVDKEVVSNLMAEAGGTVSLHAAWEVWTIPMQMCDNAFGGAGVVSLDDDDNIVVTLTNDVSGTVEIPDNVGAVTIDLNGHDMVGDGGPAIRIVKGDGDGATTRLAIVDTSNGEKGQIAGGGESAGIEVVEDAATGVKLDVEEGVGVFNGDGTEQVIKTKRPGTGKVTVPKSWKTGQKVTWKATADKGSVFAHWEGPLVDSLNLTKNERRNPSLAFAVPEGFDTNQVTAVFIMADDDGLCSLNITQTEFAPNETLSDIYVTDDSWSYVTASVKGLPPGVKFDAKTMRISGKATKPGVYAVTVSATNATVKKPVTAEFEIVVPNLTCDALPNLMPETDAYGTISCGVAFDPGLVDCSPEDGWTVKVAGLPAGLKYDAKTGKITGVPTKAGTFTVTFTATRGKEKETATITLTTEALPDWAAGTFVGHVRRSRGDAPYHGAYGFATMTVAASGKISGKFTMEGTNWTFSAASYAAVDSEGFLVDAVAKAGKATMPVEMRLYGSTSPETDGKPLVNGGAEGGFGGSDDAYIYLWRNMWKDKATSAEAKSVLAGWEGVYTLSMEDGGYASLTVGKNGDVKIAGKLADGTALSATSPFMYQECKDFFAVFTLSPSAYKGGFVYLPVGFGTERGRLDGLGDGLVWSSRNPQATDEYGAGFERWTQFTGAYYDKTKKLSDYYEALRFATEAPILQFTFKETYIGEKNRKTTESYIAEAYAADTLSQPGLTAAVNEKGAIVVAKATKPVQDKVTKEWYYEGANDGALALSFTQATGIFKGSYTFWYDYVSAYDDTTGKETTAHTSKKVNFEGVMVQGEEPKMNGFYLWDATGVYEDEKTGKEKTYKYKESFPVMLLSE